MSQVFGTEDERPVDLFANDKNSKYQTNDFFPVQSPPNESDNLNVNHEATRVRNALTKRVNAHKAERKRYAGYVSKSMSVVMNEVPNLGMTSKGYLD
jgi:hypothetical protein